LRTPSSSFLISRTICRLRLVSCFISAPESCCRAPPMVKPWWYSRSRI